MSKPLDTLVIGAGPAGLTSAIYLARFHLDIAIVDAGESRAATIPRTHNHAGFPGGISGKALLSRMRRQTAGFGAVVRKAAVERLEHRGALFVARLDDGDTLRARSVLLATGVVNRRPPIDPGQHDRALKRGLLRYCPICDGFEVTDKRVGVIGTRDHGYNEALFLRMYSRDVTLIAPDGGLDLTTEQRGRLAELGIGTVDGPCGTLILGSGEIGVPAPGAVQWFDTVYPALGSQIRSELAAGLGATMTEDGCIVVDQHQRTSLAGLYAAGDVVRGLDQISHAMGEAGVAATTIRNDLSERLTLAR